MGCSLGGAEIGGYGVGGYNVGGSFFGDVGSFFTKKVFPALGSIAKTLGKEVALPLIKKLVGVGYTRAEAEKIVYGRKGKGKGRAGELVKVPSGGELVKVGGQMMSPYELRRFLQSYR